MAVTRRRFLQGSAAVGGAALGHRFLFGGTETLASTGANGSVPLLEESVHTACWIGKQDCGMVARRVDGRVVKLEGDPANPRNLGTLCPKGQAQLTALYDPNRVTTPLVRTNEKGRRGEWRQASWDEALGLVAEQVKETRARDPKLVLWQKGRSKAKEVYDDAFTKALGCSKVGHGAYCSDAGYRALEYTVGVHGVLHPDIRETRYLLAWGWNITAAGGNKLCWITWPRELVEARERHRLKVVHIDPRLRSAGPFADTWLPIRPGTDLALALAICNVLVDRGHVDAEYLARYTNAPYLVGEDGLFVRDADQVLVWDPASGAAVPAGQATSPAIEGRFQLDGAIVRPAFELFKDHVAATPPEWAADICGISARQIIEIATELGEQARIGSTTVVDGVTVPYRPVGIMAYHMAQQELGFPALRAMTMITMLVGAVGAVGGQAIDFKWKLEHYDDYEDIAIDDPPYDFLLKKSRFFPINTGSPAVIAKVMEDPAAFDVEKVPEVLILHMVNPLGAFPDQKAFLDTLGQYRFVAAIDPWLSETADYFADVVLPAATLEKYEGPLSADDPYLSAKTVRLPVMEPLGESKGDLDIYLDLCEALGVLKGPDGYVARINEALALEGSFALPTGKKPTARDIIDAWARSQGLEGGIEYFEKHGTWVKGPIEAEDRYGYATDPPFGGAVHRLYGESLLRAQQQMKEKGTPEAYWRDYTALPAWRAPTMDASPSRYDLYLISYKLPELKQSRSTFFPMLTELVPKQRLVMNPRTARDRGIEDGDTVTVESHNSVTGEIRKLEVEVELSEGIRPDTVGMPHHFGLWANPVMKDRGPSPNELFFTGEGYWLNTADQSYHVKVRVSR